MGRQIYYRYTIFIVLLSLTASTGLPNYTWLEFNDLFDGCVVITLNDLPIVTASFIGRESVITSANAVERLMDYTVMHAHVINGGYLQNRRVGIRTIYRDIFRRNSEFWRPFGVDNRHSPMFDVVIVALFAPFPYIFGPPYRLPRNMDPYDGMHRRLLPFEESERISFASFGFIDKLHLRDTRDLEMAYYIVADVITDCDEWIPREWGHFICLLNVEDFACTGAGAPLMYRDRMVGMGAFSVTKGNETILVFTDIRKYWGTGGISSHNKFYFTYDRRT